MHSFILRHTVNTLEGGLAKLGHMCKNQKEKVKFRTFYILTYNLLGIIMRSL